MTAMAGHYAPSRKSGVLGVHSVGEFVLGVPSLEKAEAFYSAFGLEVREEGERLNLHTAADGYRWGCAVPATSKSMHQVSFHCFEEDLPRFKAQIEQQGVRLLDLPPGGLGRGAAPARGQLLSLGAGAAAGLRDQYRGEPAPVTAGS
jgi:catechol 2,3-dioxygenase-like lactoylglutathione lyase family enzyme